MKPRWRKVFLDLIENKARTLLVVLSIASGRVFDWRDRWSVRHYLP